MRVLSIAFLACLLIPTLIEPTAKSSEMHQKQDWTRVLRSLRPSLEIKELNKLQKAFIKVSHSPDCNVPWTILLSVAFNESSLRKYAINDNGDSFDYGLMQINDKTAKAYKLDKGKLLIDEEYNIRAGCRIIRSLRDLYGPVVPYWIGFYRAGTAVNSPSVIKNAKSYHAMIHKTIQKIYAENKN